MKPELKRAKTWPVGEQGGPLTLKRSISHGATDNSGHGPLDRRSFRSHLARLRARQFGVGPNTSSIQGPTLFQQAVDAESVLLSNALAYLLTEAQQLKRHTLPDFPSRLARWNADDEQQRCQFSCSAELHGIQATLVQLETELNALHVSDGNGESAADDLHQRLSEVDKQLASFDPEALARTVRQFHHELRALVARLTENLHKKFGPEAGRDAEQDEPVDDQRNHKETEVTKALQLSAEQGQAVECAHSIFLQGRSGTGKTLVLIRRMIRMRSDPQQSQYTEQFKQLYVTKSSLLRNDVVAELGALGCHCEPLSWPPTPGVFCITWDQLVQLLHGSKAVIGYERFLQSYWPRLCVNARQLSPLLIWTEFNTRLRPFGRSSGLSLDEYLRNDISATGIPLDRGDQHAIHWMFTLYTRMKIAVSEKDDVDVALELLRNIASRKKLGKLMMESLLIDEAQDFSPTELMMLFTLCKTPESLTVAGDTCQTINPGSAFSFQDIADAFCAYWKRRKESLNVNYKILTLSFNYRCGPGVAALAGSVTSILLQRFPRCADKIEEKTSLKQGGIPLFVQWAGQQSSMCIMGTGSQRMSRAAASQTIVLVRTDAQRQILVQQKVQGTVLTVAEAKGLEFDFVVVCGLLSSLPDDKVCALADPNTTESELACTHGNGGCSRLSGVAHALLCQVILAIPELKTLYVALTRARKGVVLLECGSRPQNWTQLLASWQHEGLVELWDGEQGYVGGVQASPSHMDSSESGCQDACVSASNMMEWIDCELQVRGKQKLKGKAKERNKREIDVLKQEWKRLREGGPVDEGFGQNVFAEESAAMKEWIAEHGVDCSTKEGMITWLQSQLQATSRRFDKAAQRMLHSELNRLQLSGSKINDRFCDSFALLLHANRKDRLDRNPDLAALGGEANRSAQPLLRVPRPVSEVKELPSLVPVARRRFGLHNSMIVPIEEVISRAETLMSHASDNPRERWQIYAAARQTFLQGIAVADTILATQVERAGRKSLFSLGELGDPGTEDVESDALWSQQLCVVLQESCRQPSLRSRGSTLQFMGSLQLWSYIFSFIVPESFDTHNILLVVVERALEHAKVRHRLMQQVVQATAFHLLEGARHDAERLAKEERTLAGVHSQVEEACSTMLDASNCAEDAIKHCELADKIARNVARFIRSAMPNKSDEYWLKFFQKMPLLSEDVSEINVKMQSSEQAVRQAAQISDQAQLAVAELPKSKHAQGQVEEDAAKQVRLLAQQIADYASSAREAEHCRKDRMKHYRILIPEVAPKLEKLLALTIERAEECAESGRAFLLIKQLKLAAEAFASASSIAAFIFQIDVHHVAQLTQAWPLAHIQRVWTDVRQNGTARVVMKRAQAQKRRYASCAARCWLLTASEHAISSSLNSKEEALAAAATHFCHGGYVPLALACLSKTKTYKFAALCLLHAAYFGMS